MIERHARRLKHVLLYRVAARVGRIVPPMSVTLLALAVGLSAAGAAALGATGLALLLWFLNRFMDGLDGEVARVRGESSDFGGYVDMMGDVVVYAAIPLAVAYARGEPRVTAAVLVMIASFYINITSWTYLSALLEKRHAASDSRVTAIEMPSGLIEGAETIVVYGLLLGIPTLAVETALVAAAAGLISTAQRMFWAIRTIRG
jgi:phosphatidylserine synthase